MKSEKKIPEELRAKLSSKLIEVLDNEALGFTFPETYLQVRLKRGPEELNDLHNLTGYAETDERVIWQAVCKSRAFIANNHMLSGARRGGNGITMGWHTDGKSGKKSYCVKVQLTLNGKFYNKHLNLGIDAENTTDQIMHEWHTAILIRDMLYLADDPDTVDIKQFMDWKSRRYYQKHTPHVNFEDLGKE